jgi:GNAT superfamily N-acetyltransferase
MGARLASRRISADETIELRWEVLRPGFPRETAVFPGDDQAIHLGVFQNGQLAGVASLFDAGYPGEETSGRWLQLRGMATAPDARGSGCGRELLSACEAAAREEGVSRLWCNARRIAVGFYEKHGWEITSEEFDIPSVGPHFRMRRELFLH